MSAPRRDGTLSAGGHLPHATIDSTRPRGTLKCMECSVRPPSNAQIRDLTSEELRLLADTVHTLADGSLTEVRAFIAERLHSLLRAEQFASFVWNADESRYENPVVINQSTENIQRYAAWFQYRDPVTPRMRRVGRASIVADVISPRRLERTEFYNDFLRRDGLYHGVNLFLRDGDAELADFRIWRSRRRPAFAERETILLDLLAPYIKQALLRERETGLDALTSREREVAVLVGRGCTDKEIASVLGVRFSTVRTHLGRCLSKLGCSNRAELAARVSGLS